MSSKLQVLLGYLKLEPDNVDLNVQVINAYQQSENVQAALSFISQLPSTVEQEPNVKVAIIQLLLHLGHFDQAQANANQLVELTSAHPTALYYLALSYYLSKQPQFCIEMLTRFEAEALEQATLLLIVRSYLLLGNLTAAKDLLMQLETSAEVLGIRALVELDLDNTSKATELCHQALALEAEQYEANLVKASVFVRELNFEQALTCINTCLQLIPNEGRALSLLGQSHFYHLNFAEAAQVFAASVANMPEHIGTWHLLGWAHLLLGQLEQSEIAFASALKLNGNFADSHGAMAVIAIYKQDLESAETSIKVALRLDPRCATAMYAQSLLLQKQGNAEQAQQLTDRILNSQNQVLEKSHMALVTEVLAKVQ